MATDVEIMSHALSLAEENMRSWVWWPVACIIAKNKEIIFSSLNKMSEDGFDPTAHAEITTIREFCKQEKIRECSWYEMYVTAEPCPMCLWAIYRACFDAVYFCTSVDDAEECKWIDKKIYQQFQLPKEERVIPCVQVVDEKWKKMLAQRDLFAECRPDLSTLIQRQRKKLST
jgi:guanine deaminase